MKRRAQCRSAYVIALLCGGSAIPATGWTHWEGIEAADPATPAAVLRLDSAAARYTTLDAGPLPWRALFDGARTEPDSAAAAPHTPATTQQ